MADGVMGKQTELGSVSIRNRSGGGDRVQAGMKRRLAARLRRAAHTGPAGIADRGRQQLRRVADRIVLAAAPGLIRLPAPFDHLDPRVSKSRLIMDRGASVENFRELPRDRSKRFFAGVGEAATASYVVSRFPAMSEAVLARADDARAHIFTLMAHRLSPGAEALDWHRDAVSGRRAPLLHWSRINALDYATVGDSKITWELNRHQWVVDLAQAYRFSGREAYAESALAEVESWMQTNPPGIGINWSSSLEVALRLIAWCWTLSLLCDSQALTSVRYERMLGWIKSHAAHVDKYLSRYFSPNTHLTGEALGLAYAGTLFPELAHSARWRHTGVSVLLRQLPRQVLADGVYFEQSSCYARYTAEIYLHLFILAERNGIKIPAAASARLCRLLDYLLRIRRPDGSLPQIGDADGGRLLPLAPRCAEDCRDVFAVAAAWFGRPDYAWAAGDLAPEVAWLLGSEGCERFERLKAAPPDSDASKLFPKGGWAVMRSGWESDAHQLVFDVGPLGCPFSGGHGHADLLSIQCSTFGRARLGDPGTYCYTAEPRWRNYFRGSHAHSTVVVDGKDQVEPAGCFSWAERERPEARLNRWMSTRDFDYADAEHRAYGRLADPVLHRRRILFVKPRYWVLVDDLRGMAHHRFELIFQFEPLTLRPGGDGWMRCSSADGRGLCLHAWAPVELERHVETGELEPPGGWTSPDYGVRNPAPRLRYTGETKLPARLVTLLLPMACTDSLLPEVAWANGTLRLDFPVGREVVRITDTRMFVENERGVRIGPFVGEGGKNQCVE